MKHILAATPFLVSCAVVSAGGQTLSGVSLGVNANLNGWRPGTTSNVWRTPVDTAPLDPSNSAWQTEMTTGNLAGGHIQADASIPYSVVDNTMPLQRIILSAQAQRWGGSDNVLVPVNPDSSSVEQNIWNCPTNTSTDDLTPDGNLNYTGDRHALILNRDTGFLYEMYDAYKCRHGYTVDSSVTVWDTSVDEQRPQGMTSVDAAGLSVFMGLVNYDEAASGTINHALRFTMPLTHCVDLGQGAGRESAWVAPATHGSCVENPASPTNNIMGMRIRLQASFDETPFAGFPRALAIIHALKKYGAILADNGSTGFYQITPDARWNGDELAQINPIKLYNFEVIQMGPVITPSSVPTGALPVNSAPTITPATISVGQCATVTWTGSGSSYEFVQGGSPARNHTTQVCPTATTTFKVESRNQYGATVSTGVPLTVLVPPFVGGATHP